MVDLVNYPLNVRQGQRWADRALARTDLAPDDRAFAEDCRDRLANLDAAPWEPTDEEWDRLMHLAGG